MHNKKISRDVERFFVCALDGVLVNWMDYKEKTATVGVVVNALSQQ